MTSFSGGASSAALRNHFSMLGLPEKYAIDLQALERAWKAVQSAVHPDRFASGTDAQRLVALQYSTQINEAHDTLKDPIRRAAYLCQLHGVEIDAERNTAMPADFLVQQMEWREALDDAVLAQDSKAMSQLEEELGGAITETDLLIEHLLDRQEPDYGRAAQEVRRMMFLAKFKSQLEVEQRRVAHGTAANR